MLSTYCLLVKLVPVVGKLATLAEVNAAVEGVTSPIALLFIVVSTTGTVEPVDLIIPKDVPSIFTMI